MVGREGEGRRGRRFREEAASKPRDIDLRQGREEPPLPGVVEELASMVAVSGEELEEVARHSNTRAEELDFLLEREGSMYRRYRARVAQLREAGPRRKRSRWGAQEGPEPDLGGPGVAQPLHLGGPGATGGQWSQQQLEVSLAWPLTSPR